MDATDDKGQRTMTYPKAFEAYWRNVSVPILPEIPWVGPAIKRIAFNAWKAGRRYATALDME